MFGCKEVWKNETKPGLHTLVINAEESKGQTLPPQNTTNLSCIYFFFNINSYYLCLVVMNKHAAIRGDVNQH